MYGTSTDVLFAVTSVEDKRSEFAMYGGDAGAFRKIYLCHLVDFELRCKDIMKK